MTQNKKQQAAKLIETALATKKEHIYVNTGSMGLVDRNRILLDYNATIGLVRGQFRIVGIAEPFTDNSGAEKIKVSLDSQFDESSDLYHDGDAKPIIDSDLKDVQTYVNQYIND